MAAKNTSAIIPLAHSGVGVEACVVDLELVDAISSKTIHTLPSSELPESKEEVAKQLCERIGDYGGVRIAVSVSTTAKTGVEMEALTGVVGAGLTVVDMCKAVDRDIKLEGVQAVGKMGGKSGGWGVFAGDGV